MKNRAMMMLGVSALVLCTGGVSAVLTQGGAAVAGAPSATKLAKQAAADAEAARKAIGDRAFGKAVRYAERAVAGAPDNGTYRALLGHAYLQSGRFASARDAFGDALTLMPNDGRSALSYALAQIATGDWVGARQTLESNAETIPVADRALATALAGDPAVAVEQLAVAARSPGADAKTRQNLALALALSGRWAEARAMAELDVAPNEVDARMIEWAKFARPTGAADQVSYLLGVTPVMDPGQPVSLALARPAPATPVVAAAEPAPAPAPAVEAAPQPAAEVAEVAAPVEAPRPTIVFAERKEVVQPLPVQAERVRPVRVAKVAKPVVKPVEVAATVAPVAPVATKPVVAKGNFYVQLGAFENAAVARDGWARAVRRYAGFVGQQPSGMAVKTAAGQFYRLSVGGYARNDAVAMCQGYRAAGGTCFVRQGAGDQVASWVKPTAVRQLASR
ncbi:tetratricopeptide repeat protein [Sphingomonas sp.]|uniref:SPOR domain-containing protein n=1 Tax=Sphingomonas sp. TaxID=28214 RepID=UPI001D2A40F6|nr:tetratricopeptide repeat protein [Sphingomonas sp.]MBX9796422.1 tetratricopeptide repeat protein [Sphingomonas sp.]